MPLLGFGTWEISDDDATGAVSVALEVGYRHIDTATGYGNETGDRAARSPPPVWTATRSSSPPSCRPTTPAASGRRSRRAWRSSVWTTSTCG